MRERGLFLLVIATLVCVGCASRCEKDVRTECCQVNCVASTAARKDIPRRVWTDKQLDALRSFALAESPKLWQTVQMLKAENASRKAALESLCKEMKDFGRNPDTDTDVVTLRAACDDLNGSLVTIYGKLEEAYIAYKKMQATPGHKEYVDMMKIALEDGIQEADATAARYREMSRNK